MTIVLPIARNNHEKKNELKFSVKILVVILILKYNNLIVGSSMYSKTSSNILQTHIDRPTKITNSFELRLNIHINKLNYI